MNKLGRPHIPNATYQVPRSSAFWFWRRRFLKGFYHIWAWPPSWSCDQDRLNKLSFLRPKESPYEIWGWLAKWFQRRRCLKLWTDGRTDDRRRTDAGVTGILLAHPWAFGSGELKSHLELLREITLLELASSPYFFALSICLVYMNKFARFDGIPAMTLQVIKETKCYGRIPATNKVGGGDINRVHFGLTLIVFSQNGSGPSQHVLIGK